MQCLYMCNACTVFDKEYVRGFHSTGSKKSKFEQLSYRAIVPLNTHKLFIRLSLSLSLSLPLLLFNISGRHSSLSRFPAPHTKCVTIWLTISIEAITSLFVSTKMSNYQAEYPMEYEKNINFHFFCANLEISCLFTASISIYSAVTAMLFSTYFRLICSKSCKNCIASQKVSDRGVSRFNGIYQSRINNASQIWLSDKSNWITSITNDSFTSLKQCEWRRKRIACGKSITIVSNNNFADGRSYFCGFFPHIWLIAKRKRFARALNHSIKIIRAFSRLCNCEKK